ncbi:MAG: class I SAM-dependent methyltransferase [Proteobacteria bacterium]|nr:class I SAM-dependent methyltransferase [Pseudomonadota bacterium]
MAQSNNAHSLAGASISWVERGLVPDPLIRAGIRRLSEQRRVEIEADDAEGSAALTERFIEAMRLAPIAPLPHLANEQHYEVPAEFFAKVLGPQRKYSSAWWPEGTATLAEAEELALAETAARAGLENGQDVLELGCGWGSLTLWMARRYPASRIVGVSNSHRSASPSWPARAAGLDNVEIRTADINQFTCLGGFDRIVSVEMFEHLRNWPRMFGRVHDWLKPGGRFFMHVFCHRDVPYEFVDGGDSDWMSRHFFSGGMMPSDELATRFQEDLRCVQRWRWDGRHYEKTANAWLENLDAARESLLPIMAATYGERDAALWLQRWRIFFMACAELFGYRKGQEWWVSHYLFERPAT